MSDITVNVPSPFIVRHALLIAMEAVYADLTSEQSERLRDLAQRLPRDITPRDIRLDIDTLIDFALCMRRFRRTHTWYWLRNDLKRPIVGFEQALLQSHSKHP